jgi:hypothetical protein
MELEGVTEVQPFDGDFQHYFTVSRTPGYMIII